MPRSKQLMKKRAVGTSGSGRGPKKIVIRPFQKPPALPANYYEQTSRELLEGTVAIAFGGSDQQRQQQQQQQQQPQTASTTPSLSLQDSYQHVVHLVSHRFGPQLYKDLVATLQKACEEHALPASALELGSGNDHNLLGTIQSRYQTYVDYLLLCKHVFLPLDRTHAWMLSTGEVVKRSGAGGGVETTTTTTTTNGGDGSSRKASPCMDLWQVGLLQFKRRLREFRWDAKIYQQWWESLRADWDGGLVGRDPYQQELLQTTLYMWQDLGILGETLSQKLEPDLVLFFQNQSKQLQTGAIGSAGGSGEYRAEAVIAYCHSKWMHVAYHWSRFLPKKTCVKLLEDHLFSPHLHDDWLLNPKHFDRLLERAFAEDLSGATAMAPAAGALASLSSSSSSATAAGASATPSSPIQQLWMLAGRLLDGYKLISGAISRYARTRGSSLMSVLGGNGNGSGSGSTAPARAGKQKIADLLELQKQLQQLLSQLPHSNEHCALKNVWEDVVNPEDDDKHDENTSVVAEALAKYVDACLKDSKKQLTTGSSSSSSLSLASPTGSGSDHWAEAVISGVFCYLQAKDTFEAFYKQDLAKRLLWNRVVSMDVERHFVSLLKAECGAGYTSKMEGMFQDMDWSRETMNRYKLTQYQHPALSASTSTAGANPTGSSKVEMDMQVLTTGFWPVYPQYPKLILPESLLSPQTKFADYYKTKYQGRRMTWQYALGHVVVRFQPKAEGTGPKYELLLSLCQALVLLQFNDHTNLKLPQLMASVGLEDRGEMERLLLSLSLGKEGTRVLRKTDHDADKRKKTRMAVHDEDTFAVQSAFRSNTRRIRINNILMKETKEEREKTVKAVSRDRLYLVDAVLVRIMKARKTILHQELIPQVLEQVKVPAQPADIKKRIETLIEREYFERDASDRNRYNYLA